VTSNVFVYYEGHLSSYPQVMVGKLMLNSRYLVFHIYEPRYAGIFQSPRLVSTGKVLSIALSAIIDVSVESGMRSRKSRPNWKNMNDFQLKSSGERATNAHPGFLDNTETYSRLMVTVESELGVEIASFEVQNPQAWEQSLRNYVKGTG
jgi:hypothetical protein